MCRARRMTLALAVATVATALCAGGAWANTPVELEQETGGACNPCSVHLDGESHFARLDTGAIVFSCQDEFEVDLYHDGSGEVEWIGTSDSPQGCITTNCYAMSPHWLVSQAEELAPSTVELQLNVCFRNYTTRVESECSVDVIVTEISPHAYEFAAAQPCPGGVRYELHSLTEAGEGFEIHHL